MRSLPFRPSSPPGLRRQVERLAGLPLRPESARFLLDTLPEEGDPVLEPCDPPRPQPVTEIDPGWVLARAAPDAVCDALGVIAERPWWRDHAGAQGEALGQHWRHAVAVSLAARRLAREAGDPEPDRVARAGLLHGLGRWAVATIDPQWLADWLAEPEATQRREFEWCTLGSEVTTLGRVQAERWGCDPLVVDAAWLHADPDLLGCAADPKRLALIQEAYAWAERTPWALSGTAAHAADPRLRLLIAEVQVRCGGPFVAPDATPHEERQARAHARLRRQLGHLRAVERSRDRFLDALIRSEPGEAPEAWAERAARSWCGEAGVTAARVVWTGPGSRADAPGPPTAEPSPTTSDERPASRVVPLCDRGRPCAEVHLWTVAGRTPSGPEGEDTCRAWQAWAAQVAERARLAARLDEAVRAHRDRVAGEEPRLRQAKLDALAEFAAGAGHELNNPLAVIVGRAQLLLVRETDPGAIRSLRAILTQAQRAHRILRDLMYVARPPGPRPRFCQPEEIVRNCLRDLREGADERGVRLVAEARGTETKVWADPDALRHLTEILLRNALEATSRGGTVQLALTGTAEGLSWVVQDNGRGITATEGVHLFDPFYCGRQAGRGLGLGLPRAARIVSQAGGEIRWSSTPGQGTTFHVHLPLTGPPRPLQPPDKLATSSLAPQPKDDQPLPRI